MSTKGLNKGASMLIKTLKTKNHALFVMACYQSNQHNLKALDLEEPPVLLKENQGSCFPSASDFSAFVIPWQQNLYG